MLGIYDQARAYLLAHNVPLRPSLQEVLALCKGAGDVLSYAQGQEIIEAVGAAEYLELDAFTLFRKGKPVIFFKDSLGYEEKLFALCHELGHIVLNHTYHGVMGFSESKAAQDRQENEADTFALCLLAPPPVLLRCGAHTAAQIRAVTGLSEAHSMQAESVAADYNSSPDKRDRQIARKHTGKIVRFAVHKHRRLLCGFAVACSLVAVYWLPRPAPLPAGPSPSRIVYVTASGTRYHKTDCYHIQGREVIELTAQDAEEEGYAPCKSCEP